jgi:NAD-dependent deacetylase
MSRTLTDVSAAAEALAALLGGARRAVVFTGAGISTESGIPDFRSPGGVWSRMQPILFDDFVASEAARLEDWRRRFEMARLFAAAEPNAAHRAVARHAREDRVALVVTQNIDGLHGRAGTPPERLVEIHGTGAYATCLSCGERHEILWAEETIARTGTAPRCACGGLVKAAVVSFGQAMPVNEMTRASEAAAEADVFVALGSSLVVYPAASLPLIAAEAGATLVIASRAPTEQDRLADVVIRTPLAETFAAAERITFA